MNRDRRHRGRAFNVKARVSDTSRRVCFFVLFVRVRGASHDARSIACPLGTVTRVHVRVPSCVVPADGGAFGCTTNDTSMVLPHHSTHTFCDATSNVSWSFASRRTTRVACGGVDGVVTVRVAVLFLLHMATTRTTTRTTTTRGASARGNT